MLNDSEVAANLAVKDLAKARKFYEETLGLEPVATEGEDAVTYRAGASRLIVYHSTFAGTNRATAATWFVGDGVDQVVRTLRERGVTFEHYDMPGGRLEGDVHVFGDMRTAWFKDPDGNILAVMNGRLTDSRVGSR
jgi:catechol 2,3-dioxygenase-like lactoylglutathione lyase family enzyme